jgi:hypothetical protein
MVLDSPWLFPEVPLHLPTFGLTVLVPLLTRQQFGSLMEGARQLFRYANIVEGEPLQ